MVRRGQAAFRQDMDERLAAIGVFEDAPQIGDGLALDQADIDGREDAANSSASDAA